MLLAGMLPYMLQITSTHFNLPSRSCPRVVERRSDSLKRHTAPLVHRTGRHWVRGPFVPLVHDPHEASSCTTCFTEIVERSQEAASLSKMGQDSGYRSLGGHGVPILCRDMPGRWAIENFRSSSEAVCRFYSLRTRLPFSRAASNGPAIICRPPLERFGKVPPVLSYAEPLRPVSVAEARKESWTSRGNAEFRHAAEIGAVPQCRVRGPKPLSLW